MMVYLYLYLAFLTIAQFIAFLTIALLVRNEWVNAQQTTLNRFENGVHVIKGYADYDTMMWRFWIWDVEKFKIASSHCSRAKM